jgi:very-short-patch-repair endonuclease
MKEEMLTQLGWVVLRFSNEEILNHGKEVLARIRVVERQRASEPNQ